MNSFRCIGLLLVVLLSACDADKAPAPAPKVAADPAPVISVPATPATGPVAAPATAPSTVLAPAPQPAPFKELEREPVHELTPNVSVVPVMVSQEQHSPAKKVVTGKGVVSSATKVSPDKAKAESSADKTRAPIASKSKSASEVVEQMHLAKPNLDLSLPTDMANQVDPVGKVAPIARKSVLPSMFGEKKTAKDSPFQLNGRLLSNEMQLQLRNENHQQVEGAALDFEFRQ
ncbi:MAG: hypothetical protein JWP80_5168 [Pseudomonas sp.]|nr:hypothetical protein [Pseudomonas sp.]